MEIDEQSWSSPAYDSKSIEIKPGTHSYAIRTKDGRLNAQGQKTWTLNVYKLYIGLNFDQKVELK